MCAAKVGVGGKGGWKRSRKKATTARKLNLDDSGKTTLLDGVSLALLPPCLDP